MNAARVWSAALAITFIIACGGDEAATPTPSSTGAEEPTATSSPAPTASPTAIATRTVAPTVAPAPTAVPPEIASGQTLKGQGELEITLAAGEVYSLDARDLAAAAGVVPTSCIDTSFYLTWQVRDPNPPDGIDLEFYRLLSGSRTLYAEGVSGQLTEGACAALEIVNNSAVETTIALKYAFAE